MVKLIPLGGYVALAGETYDEEDEELKKIPEDQFVGFAYGGYLPGKTPAATGEGHRIPGGAGHLEHGKGRIDFLHRIVVRKAAPEMGFFLPVCFRTVKQVFCLGPVPIHGGLGRL